MKTQLLLAGLLTTGALLTAAPAAAEPEPLPPNDSGTRFTSDRTGHGMFVSIDKVTTY